MLQRQRVAERVLRGVHGGVDGGVHAGGQGDQPQLSADKSLAEIGMSFQTPFNFAWAMVIEVGWYR